MLGKVVIVNPSSRLAAAHVGEDHYVVFEYHGRDHFRIGEELDNLRENYGITICKRAGSAKKTAINVLSSKLTFHQAKLVVAPWQDMGVRRYDHETPFLV